DEAVAAQLVADLLYLGQDVVADGRARLDRAGARAVRTRLGQLPLQAALDALARDDDQPEVGDLNRLRRRPVAPQLLLDGLRHLLAVLLLLHVDEVEHDDPAQIAQTDMEHDLPRPLEVRIDDGFLEPARRLLIDIVYRSNVDR